MASFTYDVAKLFIPAVVACTLSKADRTDEEAGDEEGLDRALDLDIAQVLAAGLEILFCQTLLAGQEDGSQDLRLGFPIFSIGHPRHTDEVTKIRTYVRMVFGSCSSP